MTRPRSDPRHDVLRARVDHPFSRAPSARLALDDADTTRLRRRGFKACRARQEVLRRHNRRYTSVLPFGQIENQQQSRRCWLFAPIVLVRAAALKKGCITANESFSETYPVFLRPAGKARGRSLRVHRITARKQPLDGETLRRGLQQEVMGVADGGATAGEHVRT